MPGSTRAASSVCRSMFFSKGLKGGDDRKSSQENKGKIYKFFIPLLESGPTYELWILIRIWEAN
jgi:hypothetical protein